MRELFSSASSLSVIPPATNFRTSSSVEARAASRLSGLTVTLTVNGPARCVAENPEWIP